MLFIVLLCRAQSMTRASRKTKCAALFAVHGGGVVRTRNISEQTAWQTFSSCYIISTISLRDIARRSACHFSAASAWLRHQPPSRGAYVINRLSRASSRSDIAWLVAVFDVAYAYANRGAYAFCLVRFFSGRQNLRHHAKRRRAWLFSLADITTALTWRGVQAENC